MQPSGYPQPTPTSPSSDPYSFLNTPTTPKRSPFSFFRSGSPKSIRLLMIVVGLLFIILIIVGIKSLFNNGKALDLPSLTQVVIQQQELISISSTGSQQASSQTYLNFSYTALASVTTDQNNLVKLLTANGHKINLATIIPSPTIANQLSQNEQTSNFDNVYGTIISKQLNVYKNDLSNAYTLNKSPIIRSILSKDYKDTTLLQQMFSSSVG